MAEFTKVVTARITYVMPKAAEADYTEEGKRKMADTIKETLGCDDVVITNVQLFENEQDA